MNDRIRASKVRVIKADGTNAGVVPLEAAIALARGAGLDLVEIVPDADPPVCKVLDYGKLRYIQSKKHGGNKSHRGHQIKELRLRPKIGEHDLKVKLKKARGFLEKRDKVIINVFFRGREMAHTELGEKLLNRVAEALADIAKVERDPRREGRKINCVLSPK